MKKIKRINLNNLSSHELKEREKTQLRGGHGECCGCAYGEENYTANYLAGYASSIGGTDSMCAWWDWEDHPLINNCGY
jgi:natural product precursor